MSICPYTRRKAMFSIPKMVLQRSLARRYLCRRIYREAMLVDALDTYDISRCGSREALHGNSILRDAAGLPEAYFVYSEQLATKTG